MAKCFFCGEFAPFGLRRPGRYSALRPEDRGKYLWHCAKHKPDAEARRDRAMGKHVAPGSDVPQPRPEGSGKVRADASDPKQGSLF